MIMTKAAPAAIERAALEALDRFTGRRPVHRAPSAPNSIDRRQSAPPPTRVSTTWLNQSRGQVRMAEAFMRCLMGGRGHG